MKSGDVVIGVLPGALETKARPAVVISSETYMQQRPDVLVGILTTRAPKPAADSDCVLHDWNDAGLRAESWFRAYILTMHRDDVFAIGRLSPSDWERVQTCVRNALGF